MMVVTAPWKSGGLEQSTNASEDQNIKLPYLLRCSKNVLESATLLVLTGQQFIHSERLKHLVCM
jgi:hypothetical protein